jgi:simple sugar transport system permease protein
VLDACGHDPRATAHLGTNVTAVQFAAVLFGGAMAGLAGAYLALDYTPVWNEQMGGGRGWIALALAVFASRLIGRLLLGALLFGSTSVLQLAVQTTDLNLSSHLLAAMPYLITIVALVLLSLRPPVNRRARTPRHLGEPT